MSVINKTLKVDPDHSKSLFLKSQIHFNLKQYDNSLKAIVKYIKINKNNPEAYLLKGMLYSNMKKYHNAIKEYTLAIGLNPFESRYYHSRAFAYGKLKRIKESNEDFSTAIEMSSIFNQLFLPKSYGYEQIAIMYNQRGHLRIKNNNFEAGCKDVFLSNKLLNSTLGHSKLYLKKCSKYHKILSKRFNEIQTKYLRGLDNIRKLR